MDFPYSRINPKSRNPAGLVQQNLEYYTGKATEQLDTVSADVGAVQTDLDTLEATVAALQATVTALQTTVAGLKVVKSGIVTMGGGANVVTVTHNLGTTSYSIVAMQTVANPTSGTVYVSNKTANTVDINISSASGSGREFLWIAAVW
jgi:hypothetical protein